MSEDNTNNEENKDNEDRKKREEARKKKKQRINRKKQIEASQKQAEEIRKKNRQDAIDEARAKMGDKAPKIYNKEGQEVADDGSIIVDDSPVTGPVIEPNEGDIETDEFGNPKYAQSITFEVGANVALDKATSWLLAAPIPGARPLYALANIGGSGIINYLSQRIRGTKFSFGELATASGLSLVPGATQAKTVRGAIGKGTVRGAATGATQVTAESLIDTGQLPDAETFITGTGFGGFAGGTFASVGKADDIGKFLGRIRNRLNGGKQLITPDGIPINAADVDDFQPASRFAAKTEQPSFDDELNRRYKEINNPDSYITDRADPDFGKLKSEVEPVRAAQAAADKKIYDAEKLELDKKFIMEHPLGLDNLVPDETILDLKKESRQVAALMWDINYPFEDAKGFRYFDKEIRKAMEKQFPGQDLKLRSHHLNPLKSGAAMLNGLSMEDRAEATARLLKEFGLVGGNSPFQNTVLPREIHNEIHRFLSRFSTRYLSEIGDPQFDNSFYRLSLKDRMPMLKRYAEMIKESEELIFTLMQAQNIASGEVDTIVKPETAATILSKIPTNTTDSTFKFLQDAVDDIKEEILGRLDDDLLKTDVPDLAPKGAQLKTRRKFQKLGKTPQRFLASDSEYRSMALDRIFKFRRSRQLDIFETDESLAAEIRRIADLLKKEDLSPTRGRFRK